jgi:hypothetical protein
MRNLIKIIIALAFMAVTFFVGRYLANEKSAIELKELKDVMSIDKTHIRQLQDSMSMLKLKIDTINTHKQLPVSRKTIDAKLKRKPNK